MSQSRKYDDNYITKFCLFLLFHLQLGNAAERPSFSPIIIITGCSEQSKHGRQLAARHASLSAENVAVWPRLTLLTLLTFKVRTRGEICSCLTMLCPSNSTPHLDASQRWAEKPSMRLNFQEENQN